MTDGTGNIGEYREDMMHKMAGALTLDGGQLASKTGNGVVFGSGQWMSTKQWRNTMGRFIFLNDFGLRER